MRNALKMVLAAVVLQSCATEQPTLGDPAPAYRDLGELFDAVLIENVTVLDVAAGTRSAGRSVLVVDGVIEEVGEAGSVAAPAAVARVDGADRFLIPGLWDNHVHLNQAGPNALALLLAHGVTVVRDLGGDIEPLQRWEAARAAGDIASPRIFAAGQMIESPAFLTTVELLTLRGYPDRTPVGSPEEARAAVARAVADGADLVKVRNIGSAESFAALLAAARSADLPVVGHEPHDVPVRDAIESGLAGLEHLPLFTLLDGDASARREVARAAAERGTWLTPTLAAWRAYRLSPDGEVARVVENLDSHPLRPHLSRELLDFWRLQDDLRWADGDLDAEALYAEARQQLAAFRAEGAPVLAGTDLGVPLVFPGLALHDELERLVDDGGYTPRAALAAATTNAAAFFARPGLNARIEAGQEAHLVLLRSDPTVDIAATREIEAVVSGARLVRRADIDALLSPAGGG